MLEDIKTNCQCTVTPQFFLIPFAECLIKIFDDSRFQPAISFKHFLHYKKAKRNPFAGRIFIPDYNGKVSSFFKAGKCIIQNFAKHL